MGSKIRVLSEETINQIAAGEVIENPSSVVKELVENSLDAGSFNITVEVMGGGFQQIQVTDDGIGMSKDDAILSLERHATSKVRTIEDLLNIKSMGFRGEALASIAAISKMTLITSEGQDHQGIKLTSEGGRIKSVEPCPRVRGSTIKISSLFYTVPARKKFQKSPAQALNDIHRVVCGLALARPDVNFHLISHDTSLLETKSNCLKERIEEVLGKDYGSRLLEVNYEKYGIRVEGFIGDPSHVRSNRTGQYLFMNHRTISSMAASFAAADGYGTMLETRKHPVFVLHLTFDPQDVDVNVHPQKKEVRFKDEMQLKTVIKGAVHHALEQSLALAPVGPRMFDGGFSFEELMKSPSEEEKALYHQNSETLKSFCKHQELIPWTCEMLPQVEELRVIGVHERYLLVTGKSAEKIFKPPYLLIPYEGIVVVNLQLAVSRIYFDEAMRQHAEMMDMQTLLFPLQITVTPPEAKLIEGQLEELNKLGIVLRPFGPHVFIVEACSRRFNEEYIRELIEGFIDALQGAKGLDVRNKLALRASQLLQRQKKCYTQDEAKKIVHALLKTEHPYFCPLGRKIIAHVDFNDDHTD